MNFFEIKMFVNIILFVGMLKLVYGEKQTIPIDIDTHCPLWGNMNTTFSFTRTDGFHNLADGVNMFKNRFFDLITDSICHKRHVIAPAIRVKFDSYETTAFSQMFDIDHFNGYLYSHHSIMIVPQVCMDKVGILKDISTATKECVSIADKNKFNKTISNNTYKTIKNHLSVRKQMTIHLKPSARLVNQSNKIRNAIGNKYMCIHLRTENDFKVYQQNQPPGYYTAEQIAEKIRLTIAEKPNVFEGIENAYIAGDHENTTEISILFKKIVKNVFYKVSHGDMAAFQYMETALIDQDVCEKADIFIGNNHSAWSELVYYLRGLLDGEKNTSVNFQYNANEPGEQMARSMHKFCTARELEYFGSSCKYYRRL